MKRLVLISFLAAQVASGATSYTEFYCDSAVSANNTNVNAGSTTGAPVYFKVNMNWDGTSVFTPTDGSTTSASVNAGDWASVYLDAATVAVYIAKVVTVGAGANGTITLSTTAFDGTPPASGATGRSIRVGGCWKGPFGSVAFPFGFLSYTATNGTGVFPRCNLKNSATYSITAAMVHNLQGPTFWQGMTASPGDLGKATIDGGASGTSYVLLTLNSAGFNQNFYDIIFANNGNSGSAAALMVVNSARCNFTRTVFHDAHRSGLAVNLGPAFLVACEAYACNKSANTAGQAGFITAAAGVVFDRVISHDNTTAATEGFFLSSGSYTLDHCIAESNGKSGVNVAAASAYFVGCDLYNNNSNGVDITIATIANTYYENCNFVKNGVYGINSVASTLRDGAIVNCGFGSGTQANGSGNLNSTGGIMEIGSVTYTANSTPWVDPANGDFRINLAAAKAAGVGEFTQTAASYTGTIGYPDIGATQGADTNILSWSTTFAQ